MVFFCGGSVVLRHCWELVHHCRKECYSTMPNFDNFLALLIILLFSGGNVVLWRGWWLVHQCRKNAIQQGQLLMLIGTAQFFLFPASKLYLALVVVGTTVPKQKLFISANFWWLLAQLKNVLFFGGNVVLRHCWGLVQQRRKKSCSTVPTFDGFRHCLTIIFFSETVLCFSTVEESSLYLALVVVGTTVPKQRLFISANFWRLLAQLKVVLFFGGNVVLRPCWALVQQRRKECCSKMPSFDNFKHCLTFFCFSEAVLCFSTVEGYNSAKKTVQQCQGLMLFGTVELFCIPAAMLYFGAFDG